MRGVGDLHVGVFCWAVRRGSRLPGPARSTGPAPGRRTPLRTLVPRPLRGVCSCTDLCGTRPFARARSVSTCRPEQATTAPDCSIFHPPPLPPSGFLPLRCASWGGGRHGRARRSAARGGRVSAYMPRRAAAAGNASGGDPVAGAGNALGSGHAAGAGHAWGGAHVPCAGHASCGDHIAGASHAPSGSTDRMPVSHHPSQAQTA
jgi:hypothetical protein